MATSPGAPETAGRALAGSSQATFAKEGGKKKGLTHLFHLLLRRENLGEELQVDLAILKRDGGALRWREQGDLTLRRRGKDSMRTHQGLERRVILEVVVQISVGHHPVHLDAV